LYEESLAIFRRLGNRQGTAALLNQLGSLVLDLGDASGARAYFDEALSIYRELRNQEGVALSRGKLDRIASELGQ
jgi:hypothetical protein